MLSYLSFRTCLGRVRGELELDLFLDSEEISLNEMDNAQALSR